MKKTLFLVYGLMVYAIFLSTFCYAVGFVGSLIVPKHIDSVPRSPVTYALLVNTGLLTLFALQHSVMARPAFKQWWTKFIPEPVERSTYVLLASACLLFLFQYWQPIGIVIWKVDSEPYRLLLKILSICGFGIVLVTTFLINHFDLFGLRQVWLYFLGRPYLSPPFKTPLFYQHVRHPLYLGFIIAFWATPTMTAAHLFFAIATTAYMLAAIRFEEHELVRRFGAKYHEYKRSAPMLIPFTGRTRRKRKADHAEIAN